MAKKKCPECPKGAPMWMTTFSDMTTLLLTFFVLLLSMANFDKVKMEQSFGILAGSSGIMTNPSVSPLSQMNIVAKRSIKDTVSKSHKSVFRLHKNRDRRTFGHPRVPCSAPLQSRLRVFSLFCPL